MKKQLIAAFIVAAFSFGATAEEPKVPPKGTICFAGNSLRNLKDVPMGCVGLGRMSSIAEIYERGYRVVATGTEVGGLTNYFIIEQRN